MLLPLRGKAPHLRFFVADGSELRRPVDNLGHVAARPAAATELELAGLVRRLGCITQLVGM